MLIKVSSLKDETNNLSLSVLFTTVKIESTSRGASESITHVDAFITIKTTINNKFFITKTLKIY
jgi:hypothetical protein